MKNINKSTLIMALLMLGVFVVVGMAIAQSENASNSSGTNITANTSMNQSGNVSLNLTNGTVNVTNSSNNMTNMTNVTVNMTNSSVGNGTNVSVNNTNVTTVNMTNSTVNGTGNTTSHSNKSNNGNGNGNNANNGGSNETGSDLDARAYYGPGWITSGDNGYLIQAAWARYVSGESDSSRRGGGVLHIQTNNGVEKFKLVQTSSAQGIIMFVVRDFSSANDTDMGTLILERNPLSDVILWNGSLTLNGNHENLTGNYHVNLGTRSVMADQVRNIESLVVDQQPIKVNVYTSLFNRILNGLGLRKSG
ncbi:hypothetical protein KW787_02165 [Candidatus Pacearchaeota archaeon]|nr:hypothetical protein [Candidatus Pacearchaeota archaeon]